MNQCLRCHQSRSFSSPFCTDCQSSLLLRSQEKKKTFETLPAVTDSLHEHTGELETVEQQTPVMFSGEKRDYTNPRYLTAKSYLRRQTKLKWLRISFIILTLCSIVALMVDGVLVWKVVTQPRPYKKGPLEYAISALQAPDKTAPSGVELTPTVLARVSPIPSPISSTDILASDKNIPVTNNGANVLVLSPTQLTFAADQGQTVYATKNVTIINQSNSKLYWQIDRSSPLPPWLSIASTNGSIEPEQNGQVPVSVNASNLSPDTYTANVSVQVSDTLTMQEHISRQSFQVILGVKAPCLLQATPAQLEFKTSLLQPHPDPQSITLHLEGNCPDFLTWKVTGDANSQQWLHIAPDRGQFAGSNPLIQVSVNAKENMPMRSYEGRITLSVQSNNDTRVLQSPSQVVVRLDSSALGE